MNTAETYEPLQITEKISAHLESENDFVLNLITATGETIWTRDEVVFAHALGIPVIRLKEQTAEVERGILGDIEYIPFDESHIGDGFAKLAEAIRGLRAKKLAQELD